MGSEEKKPTQHEKFSTAHTRFDRNIESLKQFYKAVHPLVDKIDKKTEKEFIKNIEEIIGPIKKLKNRPLKLKSKESKDLLNIFKSKLPTFNTKILYQNIVITLCSYLEILISDLIRIHYTASKSSILNDATINFSEIKHLQTIEEITELLIDKKIFDFTHESFDKWLNFFTHKINLEIKSLINLYEKPLIELFQRRHLFIHNGGIVNQNYIQNVDSSYLKSLGGEIKVEKLINTNSTYLDNSFRYVEVFGILLIHCLWYKLCKNSENASQRDTREANILNHCYNMIVKEEYKSAEEVTNLAIKNFKFKEFTKFAMQVNYWQSLKWQNKLDDKKRKEIKQIELQGKDNKIKLAIYALFDDCEAFFKTMPFGLRSKDITKEELGEWPLFKEMRKDPRFTKILARGLRSKKRSTKKV
jgi:hypothetical protein